MEKTYGYTPLSYELLHLFRSGIPDFEAAEKLIQQGADVNDQGDDKDDNVLSEILWGYWQSGIDYSREECKKCSNEFAGDGASYDSCPSCEHFLIPNVGASMLQIIKFFLDHGFDVTRNEGKYGAQCLRAVVLSSFDRGIIEATKMLLDAGAKNIPTADDDPDETPMDAMSAEGSYQDLKGYYDLVNIYDAAYQIYVALQEGRPYAGIDSFEAAIGKKILRVMASGNDKDSIFTSINIPTSKHDNCFYHNLYMIFDGGYLICSKHGSYWVDTSAIAGTIIDVSDRFSTIVGHEIRQVTFGHNNIIEGSTFYGQPITSFHFDNGVKLTFTTNFGEVEKGRSCSYYYWGDNEVSSDNQAEDGSAVIEQEKGKTDGVPISEEDFLCKIAKMYSEYAVEDIFHHMEPHFRYSSFWVFEEITSAKEYVDYITGKVQAVKKAKAAVTTKMMHIKGSEKPCLILEQKQGMEPACLTVERSKNGLIVKMAMMPSSFYKLIP